MATKNKKKFEIYALVHPESRETRYIGKSVQKEIRFKAHIKDSLAGRGDYPVNRWIRKLEKAGLRPEMIPIERHLSLEDMNRSEIWNIAILKEAGVRLLNVATGGAGGITPDTAKKINENLGPEGRSSRSKKGAENLGPEGCKARSIKAQASTTFEQRRQRAIDAAETKGKEGRQAAARKMVETIGEEGLKARSRKAIETMGKDGLSARSKAINDALGVAGRSARAKAVNESLGVEGRRERSRKGKGKGGNTKECCAARLKILNDRLGAEGRRERSRKSRETMGKDGMLANAKKAAETRHTNSGRTVPCGIYFDKSHNKWRVDTRLSEYGFRKWIGDFETIEEAVASLDAYRLANPPPLQ